MSQTAQPESRNSHIPRSEPAGSPLVPGLTPQLRVESPIRFDTPVDLAWVHTVPGPYFFRSAYDGDGSDKELSFANLPARAGRRGAGREVHDREPRPGVRDDPVPYSVFRSEA